MILFKGKLSLDATSVGESCNSCMKSFLCSFTGIAVKRGDCSIKISKIVVSCSASQITRENQPDLSFHYIKTTTKRQT